MDPGVVQRFLDVARPVLSLSGFRQNILEKLADGTTFHDKEVRVIYDRLQSQVLDMQWQDDFVETLVALHSGIPELQFSTSVDGVQFGADQIGDLRTLFAVSKLADDISPETLIEISEHNPLGGALFYFLYPSRFDPRYYVLASELFSQCGSTKCNALAEVSLVLYYVYNAREFDSLSSAKLAALRYQALTERYQSFYGATELFERLAMLVQPLERASRRIVLRVEEVHSPDIDGGLDGLRAAAGIFHLPRQRYNLVDKKLLVTDSNLAEIKSYLLASKDFTRMCLETERIQEEVAGLLERLRDGSLFPHGPLWGLLISFPCFDYGRVKHEICAELRRLQGEYAAISDFYKRLQREGSN